MNIETVRHSIEQWMQNFVEVPHPALGGWAPCPYARQARLNSEYEVRLGTNPLLDLSSLAMTGLKNKKVVILAYDPTVWEYSQFHENLNTANQEFLINRDLIALEDHPADPEIVNGVSMNQGTYALALVQSLSDLNEKAQHMHSKGFYHTWPEDYLQTLFQHRQDPRL
jgi:hypothetical protein